MSFDNPDHCVGNEGADPVGCVENGPPSPGRMSSQRTVLQVSRYRYTFDSSKPVGSRLVSVTMPDGTALDVSASFQVAVTGPYIKRR